MEPIIATSLLTFPTESALSEAIAKLERDRGPDVPSAAHPQLIPVSAIELELDAFNVRGQALDEHHLGQLSRALAVVSDLAPILVVACGDRYILVDGHHRLAAYSLAKRASIPVQVFTGSIRAAVLEATLRNTAATLQMDNRQRQDCGWRLVNADFTIKEIIAAAGVSRAQVSVMRKARKALGEDAAEYVDWWRAKRAAEGREMEPLTDDEHDAMLAALAASLAERIGKATGNKLATNPEVGARALAVLVGRKLPDLVLFLKRYLTEDGLRYIEEEEQIDFY